MTGAEHYREAEALLEEANGVYSHDDALIAQAQVHATLALAAAQSYVPAAHGYPARERYGADDR